LLLKLRVRTIDWVSIGNGVEIGRYVLAQGELAMKRYVVAATLIIAFAAPALAADYYVALRVGGGGCEVMTTEPTDTKKYKMMGKYSSEADAKAAMAKMAECKLSSRAAVLGLASWDRFFWAMGHLLSAPGLKDARRAFMQVDEPFGSPCSNVRNS
jgi:hypothetical protein